MPFRRASCHGRKCHCEQEGRKTTPHDRPCDLRMHARVVELYHGPTAPSVGSRAFVLLAIAIYRYRSRDRTGTGPYIHPTPPTSHRAPA